LTGRYPIRTGVYPDVFDPSSIHGLPAREITIAKQLKQYKGYKTAIFGKWHLGGLQQYLPTNYGFDQYLGIPWSHDFCPCPCNLTLTEDCDCRPDDPPCPVFDGIQVVEQPAYLPQLNQKYTNRVISFLDDNKDQKFFLYFAFQHSHHPQFAAPEHHNTSARGAYGDSIYEIDQSIGSVMSWLKTNALDEKTLVFLSSDNGASLIRFKFGGSAGELRCGKGTTWEGGQRVPGMVRWPGKIAPGQVANDIAMTIDIFPTIMNLLGIPLPSDRVIDGVDLAPILFQQKPGLRDNVFYYGLSSKLHAVRAGKYKAHLFTSGWGISPAVLCGNITPTVHQPPLLFNLEVDANEAHPINHASQEYQQALAIIRDLIAKQDCNSTKDKCYNEFGPANIFASDPKCAPWPPVPFHPWIPTCTPQEAFVPTGRSEYTFL